MSATTNQKKYLRHIFCICEGLGEFLPTNIKLFFNLISKIIIHLNLEANYSSNTSRVAHFTSVVMLKQKKKCFLNLQLK